MFIDTTIMRALSIVVFYQKLIESHEPDFNTLSWWTLCRRVFHSCMEGIYIASQFDLLYREILPLTWFHTFRVSVAKDEKVGDVLVF